MPGTRLEKVTTSDRGKALRALGVSTLAFTSCFAVWMMNGVVVTFLVDGGVYDFTRLQMGWLIGAPVLTGSLLRLPAGMLTDRFGGRPVMTALLLLTALSTVLYSFADGYVTLLLCSLGFGVAGASFAVGIAFTATWFPKSQQGTALGVFGAGNAGAAVTTMGAPWLLGVLTQGGADLDRWRALPRIYAAALILVAVVFWVATTNKRPEGTGRSMVERLKPLKQLRVWRFGLYYFLVFGGFVALAQWLIPYYVNVYGVSIVTAGVLTTAFTLPSGAVRAFGGWLSDRFGARLVMYGVLGGCALLCAALVVPRMDIYSPGAGVSALRGGTVTAVSETHVQVGATTYGVVPLPAETAEPQGTLIWPTRSFGQRVVVQPGEAVERKQLLARGVTHIYFQANIWVFTVLVFAVGILMGIGKAAVYKYIPDYYPNDVGTVGGIVGVIGGLGGFVCPVVFAYLLDAAGLWTTAWMFFTVLSVGCLIWLHWTIRRMTVRRAPHIAFEIEDPRANSPVSLIVRCPVHGSQAQVRLIARGGSEPTATISACSLLGNMERAPGCLGQCVVQAPMTPAREEAVKS